MIIVELKELLAFTDVEDQRIRNLYGNYPDDEKRALARNVKLAEEVGELSNAVLAHFSFQRKDKLEKAEKDNLPEEFADVIITSLLLANCLGVDVGHALEKKIAKIQARY